MYKRILVTGAGGFVGQYLIPALSKAFPGADIFALVSGADSSVEPFEDGLDSIKPVVADITNRAEVDKVLAQVKPDCVINMAAISHIPTSFDKPDLTWQVNLHGVLNLLEGLKSLGGSCVFLQVGSSDCYGESFKLGEPLDEDTPFKPLNPYAASKAAADLAAFSFSIHSNLKIIRARPFNHTGAGQRADFVLPAFAEQVVNIETGRQEPVLNVGNLDAQRCFLHVSDVVDAYIQLLLHESQIQSGEAFNIVSESPVAIADLLQEVVSQADCEVTVAFDPTRARPSDIPVAAGSSRKISELTGWTPQVSLQELVADVIAGFRKSSN